MTKKKINTDWVIKRWVVISALGGIILYTLGLLILVITWKVNIERDIQNKVDEKTTTFLIDLGIGNLKTNVISDMQERLKYLERNRSNP